MIAINQNGGIGDLIIALPWLEQFRDCPEPVILHTNYPDVARVFVDYMQIVDKANGPFTSRLTELVFELSDVIEIKNLRHMSPFTAPMIAAWKSFLDSSDLDWAIITKAHPHRANEMGKLAVKLGLRRWTLPLAFIGRAIGTEKTNWGVQGVDAPDRFITIHDGFDASGFYKFEASMKSWPVQAWEAFVALFKLAHPDIAIVKLGGVKQRAIKGVDLNLAGQLTFAESLRYLQSALVHVDGDSGLVHARRLFNKPSVVMFGPTNIKYFGYPENRNIAPEVCGDCWWLKRDWMEKCVKDYPVPLCMLSIKPATVLAEVSSLLKS